MKKSNLFCILSIFILASICVFQSFKKKDIYIAFDDIAGYHYRFIDSTDILKTSKILITQSGTLSYQRWEIDIDSSKITKTDISTFRKLVINSQHLIINNYGGIKDGEKALKRYRFRVLKWENNIPYILPILKQKILCVFFLREINLT